jgi:hypothetical protein
VCVALKEDCWGSKQNDLKKESVIKGLVLSFNLNFTLQGD